MFFFFFFKLGKLSFYPILVVDIGTTSKQSCYFIGISNAGLVDCKLFQQRSNWNLFGGKIRKKRRRKIREFKNWSVFMNIVSYLIYQLVVDLILAGHLFLEAL